MSRHHAAVGSGVFSWWTRLNGQQERKSMATPRSRGVDYCGRSPYFNTHSGQGRLRATARPASADDRVPPLPGNGSAIDAMPVLSADRGCRQRASETLLDLVDTAGAATMITGSRTDVQRFLDGGHAGGKNFAYSRYDRTATAGTGGTTRSRLPIGANVAEWDSSCPSDRGPSSPTTKRPTDVQVLLYAYRH